VTGHPSILTGDITEIAGSARTVSSMNGVHGLDLLTYRHPSANPEALDSAVVDAAAGPVIAAGSVEAEAQIQLLARSGAWAFTIGGAIFEGLLPGGPAFDSQVRSVLQAAPVTDGPRRIACRAKSTADMVQAMATVKTRHGAKRLTGCTGPFACAIHQLLSASTGQISTSLSPDTQ
jgi:hypothetical protein